MGDYDGMTVKSLKEVLKKRGLDQKGKKAELIARLEEHDQANSSDQVAAAPDQKAEEQAEEEEGTEEPPAKKERRVEPPAAPAAPPKDAEPEAKPEEHKADADVAVAAAADDNNGDDGGEDDDGEVDDAYSALDQKRRKVVVKQGRECPYLDTVDRKMLDFDFEKLCSVSLSNLNVYGCLVCGKFFQGRGKSSHAFQHSFTASHHVFINLDTHKVYCLPEGYEVVDSSLDDIRAVLDPPYTRMSIMDLQASKDLVCRALDGSAYMPGLIGLNKVKRSDYINVVLQALLRARPLRDMLLLRRTKLTIAERNQVVLVTRLAELAKKIWHAKNFKKHVSPHEVLQAVSQTSGKRFNMEKLGDPFALFIFLLNQMHKELGGTKKAGSSLVHQVFQGEVEITTRKTISSKKKDTDGKDKDKGQGSGSMAVDGQEGKAGEEASTKVETTVGKTPFLVLSCEIPPPPLFADAMEKNFIPQIPIMDCLAKYNGQQVHHVARTQEQKQYMITKLPDYLIIHLKRFTRNNFTSEKNNTIVTFPVRNLEMKDYCKPSPNLGSTKYNLLANIRHEGKSMEEGTYAVDVYHEPHDKWFSVQDLFVDDTQVAMVSQSEAYIQVYKRQ